MIIHRDIIQRSDEWHQLRIGRVTGTKLKEMVVGRPATFELLAKKIAAEKLTGVSCEKPFKVSDAMQEGIDRESESRAAYELKTLTRVEECGFIERDDMAGCSPDGLVGDNGLVELKNPLASTHLSYLISEGTAWTAYKWQLFGQLWVSGREWVDFASYCPVFDESKQLLIERVFLSKDDAAKIDEKYKQLRTRVKEILKSVDSIGEE